MNNTPKVTVVVPAFNEPVEVLTESLNSLFKQTFRDFECIVVDESTNPNSAAACKSLCDSDSRFHYYHPDKRLGLPASLNLAISMAQGELIARFDSDDICLPDRLAVQVDFMDNHPEVGVVGSWMEVVDTAGQVTAARKYPDSFKRIAKSLQFTTSMAHPSVVYRATVLKTHGAYNPTFEYAEDLDLWLRWLNNGVLFANIPRVLVRYRQSQTRRNRRHWNFNLRARIHNFSFAYFIPRVIGIASIATWSLLPGTAQEAIYRLFVLSIRR